MMARQEEVPARRASFAAAGMEIQGSPPALHRTTYTHPRRPAELWDVAELYCFPQGAPLPGIHGGWRGLRLKKPLAIRIDADLLAATRDCARRDHRTLTNFIETALRRRVEEMMGDAAEPDTATSKGRKA